MKCERCERYRAAGGTAPCESCHIAKLEAEQHRLEAENRSLQEASAGAQRVYDTALGLIEVARTEEPETAFSRYVLNRARSIRDLLEPLPSPPGAPAATSPSEEEEKKSV